MGIRPGPIPGKRLGICDWEKNIATAREVKLERREDQKEKRNDYCIFEDLRRKSWSLVSGKEYWENILYVWIQKFPSLVLNAGFSIIQFLQGKKAMNCMKESIV